MSYAPTRRQILQGGSALLAAATLGLIRPNAAFAARDKIVVRVERDLGLLQRPPCFVGNGSADRGESLRPGADRERANQGKEPDRELREL